MLVMLSSTDLERDALADSVVDTVHKRFDELCDAESHTEEVVVLVSLGGPLFVEVKGAEDEGEDIFVGDKLAVLDPTIGDIVKRWEGDGDCVGRSGHSFGNKVISSLVYWLPPTSNI